MDYSIETAPFGEQQTDCIIIGVYENKQFSPSTKLIDDATQGVISQLIERKDFEGKMLKLCLSVIFLIIL